MFQDILVFARRIDRAVKNLCSPLDPVRVIVMEVSDKNALHLFDKAAFHQFGDFIDDRLIPAIQQKGIALIRKDETTGGKASNPLWRFDVSCVGHQFQTSVFPQNLFMTNAHAVLLEIPMQRVGGQIVVIDGLQAFDQLTDRGGWITNDGPSSGNEPIRFCLEDGFQTANQRTQTAGVTMVSTNLCLGDGILQAVQIEQLPVAIDQVAGKGDTPPVHLT